MPPIAIVCSERSLDDVFVAPLVSADPLSSQRLAQHCRTTAAARTELDPAIIEACVRRGANPCARVASNQTVLHHIVRRGSVACVRACLETSKPIDFTIAGFRGFTVLETVLERQRTGDDDDDIEVLRALVGRLLDSSQPCSPSSPSSPSSPAAALAGTWDWSVHGVALVGRMADRAVLSRYWPVLRDAPFRGPVPLRRRVQWEDFDQISAADRKRFQLMSGVTCCSDSTAALVELCRAARPDPAAVRQLVERYADVEAICPLSGLTMVQRFAVYGDAAACLAACVDGTASIRYEPLLDALCDRPDELPETLKMLRLVLGRIHSTQPEAVCLSSQLYLLARAALKGRLAALWPVLSSQPVLYPRTAASPALPLHAKVWAYDWALLGDVGRSCFALYRPDMYEETASTAALWRLSLHPAATALADTKLIASYMRGGADTSFVLDPRDRPLTGEAESVLHRLVRSAPVECVETCLRESPRVLDFTCQDEHGYTVFHTLCQRSQNSPEAAKAAKKILTSMVERLGAHPLDVFDFACRDYTDCDFLSLVASSGLLAAFWPVMLEMAAFGDATAGLQLSRGVVAGDFACLPPEEQRVFVVPASP
eukprot:gene13427-9238_t